MKITFVCDDRLMKETGGIITFYYHLKTLCEKNNILFEVFTPRLDYDGGVYPIFTREHLHKQYDVLITNDFHSLARCRTVKANVRINYNHLGDLHVFGREEDKYSSYQPDHVYMNLKELKAQGNVYVSQIGQKLDFDERGIESKVLPMPFYPEKFKKPQQEGIAFASTDCERKNLPFLIDNVPEDIPVGLYCYTSRELPLNFKNSVVPNASIQQELAKYKMLLLPSYVDTYGYVLLEAMQYTRPVLIPQYWNRELPFDKVETKEDIIRLYNEPYKPKFDIHAYSQETERKWIELLKGGDEWRS
ncbi:glycosyltransferase family 4 protein [Enterobacter kobei]|uniref:hypothetical protein n=2 Tax=Gammaproteobacteria TaxID=1236 RepID=UPI002F325950